MDLPSEDKFLNDLAREFLSDYRRVLSQLKPSITSQDSKAVADFAHRVKGTARIFGMEQMATISEEIEKHLPHQNWREIEALYEQLVTLFKKQTMP